MSRLRLSDFDYDLPRELIAQVPARERTASRLLHVDGATLADLAFTDLPRLVAPDDLLVFNDTRVIKSRLLAAKPTGGRVELLLERLHGTHEALFQLRCEPPAEDRQHRCSCRAELAAEVDRPSRPLLRVAARGATSRSSTISTGTARCRCRRTSSALRTRATRRATRRCTRAMRAPSPRRRRVSTSMPLCWRLLGEGRRALRLRHAARRRRHLRAGHARGHRDAHDAPEWYRVPAATAAAIADGACARRPHPRRRHDQRPRARVGGPGGPNGPCRRR